MKSPLLYLFSIICIVLTSCDVFDVFDVSSNEIPKFVNHDFIELDKIKRISKFRSNVGHSYTDSHEECRTMKHYFNLNMVSGDITGDSSNVYSPVDGTIKRVFDEQNKSGVQIWIKSSEYGAFTFAVFHVFTNRKLTVGAKIKEGELIGKTPNTDIAVFVQESFGTRFISYFEVMTDELFNTYIQRGIHNVDELIFTKEYRDANPCNCNGEEYLQSETSDNWVILN
jgi:hypothetical protein